VIVAWEASLCLASVTLINFNVTSTKGTFLWKRLRAANEARVFLTQGTVLLQNKKSIKKSIKFNNVRQAALLLIVINSIALHVPFWLVYPLEEFVFEPVQ